VVGEIISTSYDHKNQSASAAAERARRQKKVAAWLHETDRKRARRAARASKPTPTRGSPLPPDPCARASVFRTPIRRGCGGGTRENPPTVPRAVRFKNRLLATRHVRKGEEGKKYSKPKKAKRQGDGDDDSDGDAPRAKRRRAGANFYAV
jgi:hypothetical protein